MTDNDLISRQKLIDDLEAWRKILDRRVSRFDDMVIHTLPVVFDLVNEQKAVKAEHKWISVKDGLPEYYTDVAAIVRNGNTSRYILTYLAVGGIWAMSCGERIDGVVTHWMPLPSVEGLHDD